MTEVQLLEEFITRAKALLEVVLTGYHASDTEMLVGHLSRWIEQAENGTLYEELAALFNPAATRIANGFDKQAAVKSTADHARELIAKFKGTKAISVDVDSYGIPLDHYDFAKSTFGTKALAEGIVAASYTGPQGAAPMMPVLDLSATPPVMFEYKPAGQDEAKRIEAAIGKISSAGFHSRYPRPNRLR